MTMAPANDAPIVASIVITTRNRREDTLVAVASSFAQFGVPLEVLVYDDASDDGTAEALRREFPAARVFTSSGRNGYIVNRNRGFHEARGAYVFSIDDDAYFSKPDIVARIVAQLEADRSIGAVAIPYVEPFARLTRSHRSAPFAAVPGQELRNYVGCAHAVRRELAVELGGYRDDFVHQGEERDFCLRLWASGHRVLYGDSGPIVHMVSPMRDSSRMAYYGLRNQILFECLSAPISALVVRVPVICVNAIRYKFVWATLPLKLVAICAGLLEGTRRRNGRRPVSRATYRKFRELKAHGPEVGNEAIPAAIVPGAAQSWALNAVRARNAVPAGE